MTILTAATVAQLTTALASAKAGDEIRLATGTYSGVSLSGIKPASTVTITSADPTKPAVLVDQRIDQCANLRLAKLVLSAVAAGVLMTASSAIAFDDVEFSGPVGSPAYCGLSVRGSSAVTVTNSEFHDLANGVYIDTSNGVSVTDTYFHDLQSDGIQSSSSSNLTYKDNLFANFHPKDLDHPDGIQHFTSDKTAPDQNITISGNVVIRGSGGIVQGIFVTDEVGVPMVNVNITDNLVIGGMYNSIMIAGVMSGSIANNTVLALPGMDSWIRVVNAPTVAVTGNTATQYVGLSTDTGGSNKVASTPTDNGVAALTAWVGKHAMPGFFDRAAAFLSVLGLPASTVVLGASPAPAPAPAPAPTPAPTPSPSPTPAPTATKPAKPKPRKMKASITGADGATYTGTLTEKLA